MNEPSSSSSSSSSSACASMAMALDSSTVSLDSPFLTVFKDGRLIDSFCLDGKDSFVLGRHTNCDILVAHPSISRHHLEIQLLHATREFLLTDLESVHGTWINGEQAPSLTPVTAKQNDAIRLGASSRIYKVQWIPHPPSASNDFEQSPGMDLPAGSVDSGHSNVLGSIQQQAASSARTNEQEGELPRILQEITVAGGSGNGMKTFNANISLQISQPKGSLEPLPPRAPALPPPPRRIPFAPLQLTAVARSPTVKKKTATGKKAKEQSLAQNESGEGEEAEIVVGEEREETSNPASSKLWLRRCNSAPPPRLETIVPPAPAMPLQGMMIQHDENSNTAPSAPPLPQLENSRIVPSAPPLSIKMMTKIIEEKRSRMMKLSENSQNPSDWIGSENATEPNSIPSREESIVADEWRRQACIEERGKLGSLSRTSSLSGAVEEEYASDKENQGPTFYPGKIQGATTKSRADGSDGGSSGATEVSRRPFQPLFLTSKGAYRPASPSVSCKSTEEDSFGLARPQRRSSSVAQNLDHMLRRLKGMGRTEPRREWHIVVDISCLMDSHSFQCLKQLEGIRETRLIIPKIVIRELDCMKRRDKPASRVLKWIEDCMVKIPSWIHVQNSSESLPVGATPPSSPHHNLSASSPYGSFGDLMSPTNGDHVLNCALLFSSTIFEGQVALLSNDTALKIKAMAEGLICESATTFCESLLSPYSERFLWAESIAHGPNWTEKLCNSNHHASIAPLSTTSALKKKTIISAARAMVKKHHVVEGLKNHCNQAQGLKVILD